MKLLLWGQDYCLIPKWQTQNTVRVIRVIAKPTTWKTSTVSVPSTQPITVQKLWRKCSIKVQPQWKVYHLNSFRCHITLFLPYFKGLIFASLVFPHTEICKSQCSTCAHAYSFVPLMFHYQVCVDIWKICPNTLSSAVTILLIPIKRSTGKCEPITTVWYLIQWSEIKVRCSKWHLHIPAWVLCHPSEYRPS